MQVVDALYWLGMVLLVAAGVVRVLAIQRLKHAHPVQWESMGRPSLIPLPGVPGYAATTKLLWKKGVVDGLNDRQLNFYIRLARSLVTLFLLDFVSALLLFVAHWTLGFPR